MKIKDFCLVNLKSNLLEYLNPNKLLETDILLNISNDLLEDFNQRRITPKNIKDIYNITEYFMIEDNINFLIKHSMPTNELYELDGIELPLFMTTSKNYYNYKILLELVEYDLYDWILFLFEKDCYGNYDLFELSLQKNINLMELVDHMGNTNIQDLLISHGYDNYNRDEENIIYNNESKRYDLETYLNYHY